jgi:hypothetical protein
VRSRAFHFFSAFLSCLVVASGNAATPSGAELRQEVSVQSRAIDTLEQEWTKRVPEFVAAICEDGPTRTAVLETARDCRTCGETPSFSTMTSSNDACRKMKRSDWADLLKVPITRSMLSLTAHKLKDSSPKESEILKELVKSRDPIRSAMAKLKIAQDRAANLDATDEILSCHGKKIEKINLDDQFPPTLDQEEQGTCYAYGATAMAEAALYRNEKRRTQLSPLYAAACSRLPGSSHADKDNIDGGYAENVLEKWIAQGHTLDCKGETCTPAELEERIRAGADFRKATLPIVGKLGERLFQQGLGAASLSVSEMETKNPNSKIPLNAEYHLEKVRVETDEEANKCAPLTAENSEHLKRISKSLCDGIPVSAAVYTKNFQKTSDGGKTWAPHKLDAQVHGRHAMVITGIEWEGETPYFIFRNSWTKGDEKTPYASKMRLAVADSCRIYRAAILSGNVDRKEPLKNSTVSEPAPSPKQPDAKHTKQLSSN